MSNAVALRARIGSLVCLLVVNACFLGSDPFIAPAPAERVQLEARVSRDSTEVSAVVALSVLGLAEGRAAEVVALLAPAVDRMPLDPVVPLLLALAQERANMPLAAYDTYADYTEGHTGRLADLGGRRMQAVRARARQEQARRLLEGSEGTVSPDSRTIVVLPFALPAANDRSEALATSLASLLSDDLRLFGWSVIDPQLARILLGAMSSDPTTYGDLSLGVRVGTLLGAGRVVQGTMALPVADTVAWDVSVTALTQDGPPEVAARTIYGSVTEIPDIERRLAVVLRDMVDGSIQRNRFGPAHTRSSAALEAHGRGLQALDREDLGAAREAFDEAVGIDSIFVEAIVMAARVAMTAETNAEPPEDVAVAVARVGELQRSVQDLRGGPVSAHQQALSEVAARERLLLSDVLGLDRLGGATLLELRFPPPGGGSP